MRIRSAGLITPLKKHKTLNVFCLGFRTQSDFYSHRKQHHKQSIPSCKNFKNGSCIYGKDICWFLHENMDTGEEIETNHENIIQKMMQMMEKMTERMLNNKTRVGGIRGPTIFYLFIHFN